MNKKILITIIFAILIFNFMPQKLKAEELDLNTEFNAGIAYVMDVDYEHLIAMSKPNPYCVLVYNLTEEEKELIYRITYLESGNQPIEGQRAVMEVILNRVLSERWPDTVTEVLSSPHQFSTWKKRDLVTDTQIQEMEEILKLVYLEEECVLPSNDYVFFNCEEHLSENCIKIKGHWFWK